jgi:hypothetical protein
MATAARDTAAIFVYKVEKGLFDLYQDMAGPHAVYVNEGDFGSEIRACVECFHWEQQRHQWVRRPEMEDDDKALDVIEKRVCVHLAAAATMEESKGQYSAKIQSEFDRIWRYVREWLGEGEPETREDMRELLAALKRMLQKYDT